MRGRIAQPDELKKRRGNPGKRKLRADLKLSGLASPATSPEAEAPPIEAPADQAEPSSSPAAAQAVLAPGDIEAPDFLTTERQRKIFLDIVTVFVPRQMARETDFPAYGRYAVYLDRWCRAKEILESPESGDGWYQVISKHGTRWARHPAAVDLLDIGNELTKLELQLGLTPLSRQTILRGLGALRSLGAAGGMFDQSPNSFNETPAEKQANEKPAPDAPASALSYLSGKLN
jgi:phage terminase small subunit